MIWKFYKYLFYQNYLHNIRGEGSWGKYSTMWAAGGMAFTCMCYSSAIITFLVFFGISYPASIFNDPINPNKGNVFLFVIGPVLHYFIFLHKHRYKKIIDEMSRSEMVKNIRKGKIIFWSYVAGSMITFAIGCFLMWYSVHTGFTLLKYFGY